MKKHCISYTTKSLIFCKSSLFFQNKARIADSLSVSILFHFTLILLKLEHALITADILNQNPTKKVMFLYKKIVLVKCVANEYLSRVLSTIITAKIVTMKIT